MTIEILATPQPAATHGPVLCPACGYDLRGNTSGRCSECGLAIDVHQLEVSGVPWAHRSKLGRFRAFWKTVWWVTADSKKVRHELAKPQSAHDAKGFGRTLILLLFGLLIAFYGTIGLLTFERVGMMRSGAIASAWSAPQFLGWRTDVFIPWMAGITLRYGLPLYMLGLIAYFCGMGRASQHVSRMPASHRIAAEAMSRYAMAPLAWLAPGTVLFGIMCMCVAAQGGTNGMGVAVGTLFVIGNAALIALCAGSVLMSVHRSAQWVARARHRGRGAYYLSLLELLGRTIGGVVAYGYLLPWCVGYWLMYWRRG